MRLLRRSPVVQFAVSGLFAMLVIAAITVAVSRHTGTQEAIRDAKQTARLAGVGIVEPMVGAGVLAGRPAALRRLDAVVRRRVLRDGVTRVKVWTRDGRIVYSDEPRLIGARYPLDRDERTALRVEAEISDLSRPENRFERASGKLLEVYLPIRATTGRPLLFEAYQRFSSVSSSGRRLWLGFAPALLGGLLLLQLVNLPLARSLARRLREGQQQREALLHRALDASQAERRLIAADLHDGVVQDMVGVSYSLAARAEQLNGHGDPEASAALRDSAAQTRESVSALRSLLIDIYPPSLHQAGLAAALRDLAATYGFRGLRTTVEAPPALDVEPAAERLLFRCAQEALRNALKHADATAAAITARLEEDRVRLEVTDDGRGFDPAVLARRTDEGHFGLRLVRDLVEDAGGRLDVSSRPGSGTSVSVEVPR
jgi:signal transduction histidine kinase